jgi:hypothetical protein
MWLAKRPSAQFANLQTRFYDTRTPFKRRSRYRPTSSQLRVLVIQASIAAYLQDLPLNFFPTSCSTQENKKITTDELLTRTKFQPSLNQAPCSSFKKLIVSTPSLLQGLHTMSLLKSVPEGLKPQECKRTKQREPPPVPYIPTKDEVQEEAAKLRNLKIKTTIKKDTTLNFPIERMCPSRGSISRIWSRFGCGVRSFSWNWSVTNGGVLGESSKYFCEASRRLSTGRKSDWHAPDAC